MSGNINLGNLRSAIDKYVKAERRIQEERDKFIFEKLAAATGGNASELEAEFRERIRHIHPIQSISGEADSIGMATV